jgi:hypothetical protein
MIGDGALGRAVAAAVWFALALTTSPSYAQPLHRVVLLRGASEVSSNSELLTRLRAELLAAGFEVVVLPISSDESPRSVVESAGRDLNPAAVVLVRERAAPELGGTVAELWVSDRLGDRTLMQSMMLDPREHSRDMSLLAVQTAELVKARLATLALPDRAPAKPKQPETTEPPAVAIPENPESPADESAPRAGVLATLSAGVGLLQDLGGLGTTWAPVARAGIYLPELGARLPGLELSLSGAATVKRLQIESPPGSARASQAFGTFDVRLHLAPRSAWHPVLSAGSGVFTVGVAGQAPSPYPTHEGRSWSGMSTAGGGLWAQTSRGLAWIIDAQVLAAWHPTRVVIDGTRIGHIGAPTLFFSAGLAGVL